MIQAPKLKDGFTPITNRIIDELAKVRLPGEAVQVLLVVIRLTWGFKVEGKMKYRKRADISLQDFVDRTGIAKPNICRAIKILEKRRFLIVERNQLSTLYGVNKHYWEWS